MNQLCGDSAVPEATKENFRRLYREKLLEDRIVKVEVRPPALNPLEGIGGVQVGGVARGFVAVACFGDQWGSVLGRR